jgi:hypothetical protein
LAGGDGNVVTAGTNSNSPCCENAMIDTSCLGAALGDSQGSDALRAPTASRMCVTVGRRYQRGRGLREVEIESPRATANAPPAAGAMRAADARDHPVAIRARGGPYRRCVQGGSRATAVAFCWGDYLDAYGEACRRSRIQARLIRCLPVNAPRDGSHHTHHIATPRRRSSVATDSTDASSRPHRARW